MLEGAQTNASGPATGVRNVARPSQCPSWASPSGGREAAGPGREDRAEGLPRDAVHCPDLSSGDHLTPGRGTLMMGTLGHPCDSPGPALHPAHTPICNHCTRFPSCPTASSQGSLLLHPIRQWRLGADMPPGPTGMDAPVRFHPVSPQSAQVVTAALTHSLSGFSNNNSTLNAV